MTNGEVLMERKHDHYKLNLLREVGHVISSFSFKEISQMKSPMFFHISAVNGLASQTKLSSTPGENFTWETLWLQNP